MTPGIPFMVPVSLLWGRVDKWNWGTPHPSPPYSRGDFGFAAVTFGGAQQAFALARALAWGRTQEAVAFHGGAS